MSICAPCMQIWSEPHLGLPGGTSGRVWAANGPFPECDRCVIRHNTGASTCSNSESWQVATPPPPPLPPRGCVLALQVQHLHAEFLVLAASAPPTLLGWVAETQQVHGECQELFSTVDGTLASNSPANLLRLKTLVQRATTPARMPTTKFEIESAAHRVPLKLRAPSASRQSKPLRPRCCATHAGWSLPLCSLRARTNATYNTNQAKRNRNT